MMATCVYLHVLKRLCGLCALQFIDQCDISAVIVNEAITFNDVVYYIAFMIEGQDAMVLAYEVRISVHLYARVC